MTTVRTYKTTTERELFECLRERTELSVQGVDAMRALRTALQRAVADLGIRAEFSPDTAPQVIDWFGLTTAGAATGALGAGALGLLIGALCDRPMAGLVMGVTAGGIAGGIAGANAVRQGWRICAEWLPTGEVHAFLEPIG
jgi:hypothetical protein